MQKLIDTDGTFWSRPAPAEISQSLRVIFVMEQHLGHQTYYENLRRYVSGQPSVEACWVQVTYVERRRGLPCVRQGALAGRAQVRRGLRQVPHDVAFFNTQVPAALSSGLVQKRPYILSTDLTPLQYDRIGRFYNHAPGRNPFFRWYKHRVNRRLFRRAAKILPWSTWTRHSLLHEYGVAADKIELLPPGVDLTRWRPGEQRAGGPLRILFVGTDFYRKGGADLLAAFAQLPVNQAELILVTSSDIAPQAGVHVYRNMQPNSPQLIALYQSCDLFVLPSWAEAFGIAAVEASAVGLPVIATAVGGLADIVVDDQTGFLIAPGDVAALAAHLRRLAADRALLHRLGEAARRHAQRHFDAAQNATRLLHLLAEVARENNTNA